MSSTYRFAAATHTKRAVVDITDKITKLFEEGESGLAVIFVEHTTAALTTADLDPGTDQDLLDALDELLPDLEWRHQHDPSHTPDHLLASIIGPSLAIPFKDGQLCLGTWQRVIMLEFDGPRERNISVALK